ncbi:MULTISPECIES: ATP-binding protein [unclassified Wenzhouxiangella]|uniref:ATP-binding protein n=1 Tax=unclassified Wenzhouxiangella TaxID=2613841 RepID=UPI000E32C51A|nr:MULTISPECIES: ATP-binding protein [unclassified Wenzhouxiangella]RFF27316.1 ATP-binding protein [Wenzhouxiangella sp. 15181]RFP68749.1 ATP-binding protein [Wenzhouxiangella sp. 15190]
MIERDLAPHILKAADNFGAVTLTGPRQSGKSTLCRSLFPDFHYANLEAPDTRLYAQEDPKSFLQSLSGGAIIDEIQNVPELASWLQVEIDRNTGPGQWILTGSQNFAISESVSQSLAGRTAMLNLMPLTLNEAQRFKSDVTNSLEQVLLHGGYPRIYDQGMDAAEWLASYVATYVERDVRSIASVSDLTAFQRFLGLCAGRSGQVLNYSALANDCGISQPTAKAWLSILEASFLVFLVPAWSGNIRKRLTRSPRMVFADCGLLCWLLDIRNSNQLRTHPLRGAVFESWALAEVFKRRLHANERRGMYFYRDQAGLEVDLVLETGGKADLIEFKSGQTISRNMTRPLSRLVDLLGEDYVRSASVLYGGEETQRRSDVRILPWHATAELAIEALNEID